MSAKRWLGPALLMMVIGWGQAGASNLDKLSMGPPKGSFEEGLAAYDKAVESKEQFHPGFKQAYQIWMPLSDNGHIPARYHLGILRYFGAGGVPIDQLEGFNLIRSAAESGYPTAQAFLGLLSEEGDGMFAKRGEAEALAWYQKAAEGNQCAGLKRMAEAYQNGELGLEQDTAAAADLRARIPDCTRR